MKASLQASSGKRRRTLITPEGLALDITLASRGARIGAMLLDFALIHIAILLIVLFAVFTLFDVGLDGMEPLGVIVILALFVLRNCYFAFFELGPRGATPGKRAVGIRIADHRGDRLTAEAVIARNLLREIELFVPAYMVLGLDVGAWLDWLAAAWFLIFALFFCFNRERMRAGDIVAGTIVVEAPRPVLGEILSDTVGASGTSHITGATYRFSDEELSVYGEHELQVLEDVLRRDRPEALDSVAEAIARKIGWDPGAGDERAFLEAYYAQLRARLERGMRFGKRKADKFS